MVGRWQWRLPNSYDERPGGVAEQDAGAHLGQRRRGAAAARRGSQDLPRRTAALAVTGQGDGTWLIDGEGEPVAPGWLWLDGRGPLRSSTNWSAPAPRRPSSPHRLRPQCLPAERPPPLAAAARGASTLARAAATPSIAGLAHLQLTGVRTDRSRAPSPSAISAPASGSAVLDAWASPICHLLPPMLDGSTTTHPLTGKPPPPPGSAQARRGTRLSRRRLHSTRRRHLYGRERRVGCSIVGSTGMHMRFLPDARQVELAPEPSGYTMPFPVPGSVVQMQSNMAATINVDWITDRVRGRRALRRRGRPPRGAQAQPRRPRARRPARGCLYHPYILRGRRARPFVDSDARAA
ncbi:MAG: hypothetical protein R3C69_04535 [Geminicoccaceae bacterium]